MRRPSIAGLAAVAVLVTACGSSTATVAPSQAASAAATTAPASTAPSAEAPSASAAGWDANAVTGDVVISGWQSSTAEGEALTKTLLGLQAAYPGIKVNYQPIAGDYPTVMATKFASGDVPDIFYVNADIADTWIDQGFLSPLDDYVAQSGFDTTQFFDGYASIFKGKDGKIYGFPKDGNTIGLAYNTDLVTAAPASLDELVTLAKSLKGKDGLKAPLCLNPGLDRGLALLYAQGGSLLNADGTASAIETDASKTAVQWYLDLFKDGLGMTASDLGAGWCGEALGKKSAALVFEGGWVDPYMTSTFPDVKYAWGQVPTGTSGSPVTISFTAAYAIGADAKNKEGAFVALQYLTGKDGMTSWTETGVALPARKDVPTPAGKDVLSASSAFAKPGSGFMPGYNDVQKAFQDAFTAEIQNKTYDAAKVVEATKAAIDKALAGG
jgi:multiple sugar transport system substrate-binding protein